MVIPALKEALLVRISNRGALLITIFAALGLMQIICMRYQAREVWPGLHAQSGWHRRCRANSVGTYVSLRQLCGPQMDCAAATIRQHRRPATAGQTPFC